MPSIDRIVTFGRIVTLGALVLMVACTAHHPVASSYGIGRIASQPDIAPLDIEVSPHGTNLPAGRATANDGIATYRASCATCHSERSRLERWTHATSLFDYIRRAMPPQAPRRLSSAEIYGVTAYLLYADGRIGLHDVVDAAALVRLELKH